MAKHFRNLLFLLAILLSMGCREKFEAEISSPTSGYLIVDGYINTGKGPTEILLSRSIGLKEDERNTSELKALVQVEDDKSNIYKLLEVAPGFYSQNLNLSGTGKYRLRIKTLNGKEYLSEYVDSKITPRIDSVSWKRTADGVQLYVNTQDPSNNTRYYQWDFQEAWEYRSETNSEIKYIAAQNRIADRTDAEQIYRCWKIRKSKNIFINSTAKLTKDVVSLNPLLFIKSGSQELGQRYRLIVKQHALSREAYEFFEKIKKNSEGMGSIFDPQPAEIRGNVKCISQPGEIVIGYVSAATREDKEIYISGADLPLWGYQPSCPGPYKDIGIHADSLIKYFVGKNLSEKYTPISPILQGLKIVAWSANVESCVDCRLQGGSTTKPDLWID